VQPAEHLGINLVGLDAQLIAAGDADQSIGAVENLAQSMHMDLHAVARPLRC
jgi:hypothetical protein